jgi:DNA invertase Pin-like site-specific DNA recombinase
VEYVSRPEAARPPEGTLIRAAQYIRKSTDLQKYSTENQSVAIHEYAERRAIQIVRTYADDGISGVTFSRREALQQLIDDVVTGKADFSAILVYDVSRRSRAQDVDEAAYYEYLCKRAGISVHYCAEPVENDGSPLAAMFKNMKRLMAGEYSRELSVKVFAGQAHIIKLGFRLGGVMPYGMRPKMCLLGILRLGQRYFVAAQFDPHFVGDASRDCQ